MKKKLIRLFIAVGLVLGVGSCADVTDTPEYYGVYKEAKYYRDRETASGLIARSLVILITHVCGME